MSAYMVDYLFVAMPLIFFIEKFVLSCYQFFLMCYAKDETFYKLKKTLISKH